MSIQEREKMMGKNIVFCDPMGEYYEKLFLQKTPNAEIQLKSITVAPFFDGAIAKEIVRFNPGLIILEMLLQGRETDGLEVLKKIKASQFLQSIPVVVCSHLFSETDESCSKQLRQRAMDLGDAAVLPKFPYPSYDKLMSYYEES